MKKVTILIAVLIIPLLTFSQITAPKEVSGGPMKKFEYTPKVKNQVEITNLLGKISLKNASGNTIIIESDFDMERPERAEGLKLLGAMEDNTNLGINVTEENGIVTISGITKQVKNCKYIISIPQGVAVNLDYSSPFASSDVEVDSYKGSLEIKTLNAKVKLTECTGPFTVNSISGDVEAIFSNVSQDEPSSLASVSGFVDVSIPADSKASFELRSTTGNIYNNLNLTPVKEEKVDKRAADFVDFDTLKRSGGNNYTLNGGGQKILLKSISGNIYLRKK